MLGFRSIAALKLNLLRCVLLYKSLPCQLIAALFLPVWDFMNDLMIFFITLLLLFYFSAARWIFNVSLLNQVELHSKVVMFLSCSSKHSFHSLNGTWGAAWKKTYLIEATWLLWLPSPRPLAGFCQSSSTSPRPPYPRRSPYSPWLQTQGRTELFRKNRLQCWSSQRASRCQE